MTQDASRWTCGCGGGVEESDVADAGRLTEQPTRPMVGFVEVLCKQRHGYVSLLLGRGGTMDEIQTEFSVSVDQYIPGLVRVEGDLDLATAPELLSVVANRAGDVALDCSGLAFIDGAGLNAVLTAHAACCARGARFVVLDPSPPVLRLIRLLELDTVLPVCSRDGKLRESDSDSA
jgi:anti-anti-sigma factor